MNEPFLGALSAIAVFFSETDFYFNLYGIPFLLTSIFILFLGAYVFIYGGFPLQRFVFLSLCLSFFLWLGGTFLAYSSAAAGQWKLFMYIAYTGVAFIPVMLFWYASVWLHGKEKNRGLVAAGFFIAAAFAGIIVKTDWIVSGAKTFFWGLHSQLTPGGGAAFLLYFLTYMALFFSALYTGYKKEKSIFVKRQIRLVAAAFFIANLGTSDFLPCYGIEVFPLGGLFMFCALLALAYTIVTHRLFDIETAIHRTILWFLTAAAAVLPFAALIYVSSHFTASLEPGIRTVWHLFLMIVFYAYFRLVQPLISRFFLRKSGNLQHTLERFSGELVHLQNLRDLLKSLVRMLRKTLYVKQLALYLWDEKGARYVPAIAKGLRGLGPVSTEPFLQWVEKNNIIAADVLAAGYPADVSAQTENYFIRMQAKIVVPFVQGGKMTGFLHLGKKENLKNYTASEINFLSQLKSAVTIALSNSRQLEDVSRLYKQVQHQNERLKELDRLKSEFLANTSHELRTPLNGILGLVESILDGADGDLNDMQRRHLGMIIESGTSLKELINNLLELSRMESGQEALEIKSFNILNVVDPVISLMENLAQKKGVALHKNSPRKISDCQGDPHKIQRVVMNLVGNAIKFTDHGAVSVTIAELTDEIEVRVKDTGVGISPEDQKIIFERFRQADGSATRRFEGTGLGLSIAREIIQRHGYDIHVQSEPGQGSEFYFRLRKARAAAQLPSAGPDPETSSSSAFDRRFTDKSGDSGQDVENLEMIIGSGEKILVIDDNPVNREVVRTRLEMHHYKVVEAADGVEGLNKLEKENPDLIILDLMMPRMSGYEFCRKVRDKHSSSEIPIIMLTAKTDMGDRIYGLQIGANDYISKPFHKDELITRVGVLLKIRAMTKELRIWNEKLEKRVEERTRELVDTQNQLIQAEKLATIGTLAGGVAHEINNPLTAVLTNAQLLKMTAAPDDKETLDLIEEGAKRCQTIVQKLLKYARKTSEEMPRPMDLNEVIRSAISMLAYQFQQESVTLITEFHPLRPVAVIPNEIEQVITNLLLNAKDAVRHLSGKGGRVAVKTRLVQDGAEVIISDNGIGIEKKHLGKIFDPFFTTKDVGMGTGLGLAVSHSILEKHGCGVLVQSEVGKGTSFILKFPLREEKSIVHK